MTTRLSTLGYKFAQAHKIHVVLVHVVLFGDDMTLSRTFPDNYFARQAHGDRLMGLSVPIAKKP